MFIDKIAFLHIKDKKILMALSKGKDTYYIPGGKREGNETDMETLIRETKEELTVDINKETIEHYGTFTAQAHGKPKGVIVRMLCYKAEFKGELRASSEIEDITWYGYDKYEQVGPVDKIIFEDLKKNKLL